MMATLVISPFKFTPQQLDLFAQASADYNKLHADEVFASKSIFGTRVVFGIATLLKVLNEIPDIQNYRIYRLKVEFKKPLLVGETAVVEVIDQQANSMKIVVLQSNEVILKISIDFSVVQASMSDNLITMNIVGTSAIDQMIGRSSVSTYAVDANQWTALKAALQIKTFTLNRHQMQLLLWTSYFVGMVYPGEDALYSQLEIGEFPAQFSGIELKNLVKDERFSLSTLTGMLTGAGDQSGSFKIKSMHLKKPLKVNALDIKKFSTTIFENKKCLILGGSRGFGAAVALQFAIQGSDVDLTYARNQESALEIQKQIQDVSRNSNIFSLDLAMTSNVNQFAESHSELQQSYDMIVLNAMTLIQKKNFVQYDTNSFMEKFNLDLTLNLNSFFLAKKLLKPNGHIVYVSSVYVDSAESGFSVYTALKSAVEVLIHADQNESRNFSYSIFRLPKMLTDQTNSPLISGTIYKTTDLSFAFVDHLSRQMKNLQAFQITRLGD